MIIISDNRFNWDETKLLNTTDEISIRMTVDNGAIGDIAIGVRNANHENLLTVGVDDLPLTTGRAGAATWTFNPSVLASPRYVIWNMWSNYTGPGALQFTITVQVKQVTKQGTNVFTATMTCKFEAGELVGAVGSDGLWMVERGAPV